MNTDVDVINIKITSDGSGAVKDIDRLTTSLTKFADAANKVNSTGDISSLERIAKATSDFADSVKSIRAFNSALNSINKTCEQFDASGAITGIELLGDAIRENFSDEEMQRMRDFADAFRGMRAIRPEGNTAGCDTAGGQPNGEPLDGGMEDAASQADKASNSFSFFEQVLNRVSLAYSSLRNIAADAPKAFAKAAQYGAGAMNTIRTGAKAAAVALKYTAGAPMLLLGKAFTRLKTKVEGFFAMFKKRLMYRLINSVISTISNGLKEGVNNVYQYSKAFGGTFAKSMDRASTSVLYLKNSLGAMAAPMLNMLIPILERVIKKVVDFVNVINRLFAQLSGASTWTHALMYPHEYAESIDDATQAAKKWKATVLGIDELNLMADNSSNDSASNNSGVDYGSMFEELPVPDNSVLGHFFDPLLKAWDTTGAFVMNAWETAVSGIKHLLSAIGTSFNEVWQNGTGQKTCELILTILGNILLIIGRISERFAQAWESGGTGTQIVQNLWNLFNGILQLIADITGATAQWAETVSFENLLDSVEGITGTFNNLATTLEGDVLWVYQNVMLPIASWVIEDAAPASIDAVDAALKVLHDTYLLIKPGLEWLWEHFLKPLGEWTGQLFIDALTTITDTLTKLDEFLTGQTSFSDFVKSLDDIEIALLAVGAAILVVQGAIAIYNGVMAVANVVSGVFGSVLAFLTSPITLVTIAIAAIIAIALLLIKHWDEIKAKAKEIWEKVSEFFSNLWDDIEAIWKTVSTWFDENVIQPISKFFEDLWTSVSGFFSSLWDDIKGVWESVATWFDDNVIKPISGFFEDLWTGIKSVINSILGGIESFVNFFVDAINWIIKGLNKISFDIPDWVPLIGGKTFGFNLKEVAQVTLPRLAEGGVVNAGTMFVAGEAGAEIVADIGNRTGVMNIDQMQDAVRDGITEGSEPQNALLRQILYLVSSINDKDFSPEITTGDIRRSLSRANRRDGRTVIPVSP